MLRQITYRLITLMLLIPYIAASTGLSIFIHQCSCEQRTITTLFEVEKCQERQVPSCCDALSNSIANHSEGDCGCKSYKINIKIDDIYNSSGYSPLDSKKFSFYAFKLSQPDLGVSNENQSKISNKSLYIPENSPPVKPVGRALVYMLHQSKTPNTVS